MNTKNFNEYSFIDGETFDGLTPAIMEKLPTIGLSETNGGFDTYNGQQSLEVIDFNSIMLESDKSNKEEPSIDGGTKEDSGENKEDSGEK